MLHLLSGTTRDCEGISRRSFLQVGTLAGIGLSLPMVLAAKRQALAAGKSSSDVNCILVWAQGGTSHHDTFDPKPNAPVSVKGEFNVIDTAIPGVKFTEVCPTFAKEAKRFALLRGWNPQNGSHGTADQYVMSGRKFNQAIHYPTYGSVISYHHGFKSAMPPFIQLGTSVDHRFGGGMAGVLGLANNPFEITSDPNADKFTVRDITPPSGITAERIDRRKRMLEDARGPPAGRRAVGRGAGARRRSGDRRATTGRGAARRRADLRIAAHRSAGGPRLRADAERNDPVGRRDHDPDRRRDDPKRNEWDGRKAR